LKVGIVTASDYSEESVRAGLERLFAYLGYDLGNPLKAIISPGDTVFIKPNWVAHRYRQSCPYQDSVYSTITHEMVIKVVADYVAQALEGKGRITIGDNPSIDADFDKLMDLTGLKSLETRYSVPCSVLDLRPLVCPDLGSYGKKHKMKSRPGDPQGVTCVDLGRQSLLNGMRPWLFRGVFDDRRETIRAHSGGHHQYTFSNSAVNADVYISIPKLKTHAKCGATLNLKGLVGTVADKNLLVHWRIGWPSIGGDEQPSFREWVKGLTAKPKKRGAWPGNDTIWRMVVDLYNAFNRIRPRRTFSVVDGIVAGEGQGPFCPKAKNAHVLVAGENLLAVDCVAARLMGFNVRKIPYLNHLLATGHIDLRHVTVVGPYCDSPGFFESNNPFLDFVPPRLWNEMRIGAG